MIKIERTYSIIAVADQERPVSGDVYLVARIGPHCANAEEAALWYARGMRQRERSAEAIIANHKAMAEVRGHLQVRPLLPSLWPLLVLFAVIGWCLGVLTERVLA